MKSDTALSALEQLRDKLHAHGWPAELQGAALRVRNPEEPRMNDRITCCGSMYRWSWGPEIGPDTDVSGAAERIMHVLRTVDS
ncbi:hypothetical protein [Thermostaphylospora chromogena]|uniref:Uncharacterized protein n=1 Tax=Thermostaphylospora chromogena TaxID=35622 RepID=A0A1H1FCS6_9ACTN|nr:hypothetical protein [Thermostaphylospora chromogena]SDQ98761.1 hypothetical protein SAMN04489764_2919 [Thermostaphylospora chromogena]